MGRDISPERKAGYYVGIALTVLGVLLFASVFLTHILHFGDFTNFDGRATSMGLRAFGGMGLIIVGNIIRRISARGLRGSGVILDPKGARDDLEPYSRMAGGMVKDALDEADVSLGRPAPERVVMIRCQGCGQLNEEDSKFCQECGRKL